MNLVLRWMRNDDSYIEYYSNTDSDSEVCGDEVNVSDVVPVSE